jgi:hypothetical protein
MGRPEGFNYCCGVCRNDETSLYRLNPSRILWQQDGLKGIFDHLKHRFIDFTKVEFCDIPQEENEFSWLYDRLKHRFIDITKVAFYEVQK